MLDAGARAVTPEEWAGFVAGATPFTVAGILFAGRIIRQRRCPRCKGSGLVESKTVGLRRCPECGGFLPWRGWQQFFQDSRSINKIGN
eukprot:tig00021493_g21886.t1